jgi:hypothetical protein
VVVACGTDVHEPAPPADEAALMPADESPAPQELDFESIAAERARLMGGAHPMAPGRPLTTAELERLRAASPVLQRLLEDSKASDEEGAR